MPAGSRAPDPANIDAVTKFVARVASMAHQDDAPTCGLESLHRGSPDPWAAAYLTLSAFQPDDPLRSVTAVTGVVTQILAIVAGLSAAALFLPSRTTGRPDSPDGRHPDSP